MSNVFLSEGTFNLSSGTANIIGSNIGASNLLSGSTVKVNSNKQLYSTALALTDVQGLTTALGSRLSNPSSVPIIGPSFVKSGGTSSQYLMADGSVTTGGIGATGPTGATGPAGADGLSSSVFVYTFVTQTSGTPASGNVFLNDAPVGATYLYVNHLAKDGHDLDQLLNNVSVNSNLIVQRSNDSNIFAQYTVTSKTVFTGYVRYGLTYIANTGTLTNNSEVLLIVQQAGPQGPAGTNGTNGAVGATGPTGATGAAGANGTSSLSGFVYNSINNGTQLLTAGTKQYMYAHQITYATTISGFNIFTPSGSDSFKVGIYRGCIRGSGAAGTATLVGQSTFSAPTTITATGGAVMSFTRRAITAETGQNLSFVAGEFITIAFHSSGSTNVYWASPTPVTVQDLIYTTSAISGSFPATLSTSNVLGTLTNRICIEFY